MKKRILGFLLAACLTIGMVPMTVGAATTTCTIYSGTNVEAQNYSRYASPMESYLSVCEDGSLMRVQYASSIDGVLVEYYDENLNLLSTNIVAEELPLFGGFYETGSNYFLLTGQTNTEESADVEVYRITKYDKAWKRIASTGLYDCNTTVPFDAGSARMDICGNYLLIRTSHEMYTTSDGKNHQANVTIQVDMDTMNITDSYTRIMNSAYGYVSHSFNQFIKTEDNKIVSVDHGDAHPRSIALIKYQTDVSSGKFSSSGNCKVIDVLKFPGDAGENVTGASVGGFEISDSAYLVAGNSVIQDESNLTRTTRNVFVASVDKSTDAVTMNWLTNYEEGDGTTSTPQMVEIANNTYMLLWSRDGNVYYTKVNGIGQHVGETYSLEGALSDCVPVVNGDKLIWYTWNQGTNTFYDIDLNNLSQTQTTVIENGHHYENQGVTDGYATLKCSECDDEKTLKVATSITSYWDETGSGYYSSTAPASERLVGSKLYFWIGSISPSDADQEMEILVSDPDVISYEPSTGSIPNMGSFSMLKAGSSTVTIRPKYNPDAAVEYTFTVADHNHEYEWTGTENGVINFKCKYCDVTKEGTAPTNMSVWWNEEGGEGYYWSNFTNGKDVGEKLYVFCEALPDGTADTNIEVEIADPSVISFVPTTADQRYGIITALKTGQTTITFSAKYNPSISKTYTIKVNGDLAVNSFTADKASPQMTGSSITLSANAIGGTWGYLYKFYEKDEAGNETVIRDYASSSSCVWTPDAEGNKSLYVDVKDDDETVVTASMEYVVEAFEFKITRASLMLENDITVIFKAPAALESAYHDIYVEVVQEKENGETETQKIPGVKSADGEFYEFRYTGVNAKEVGDNLDATIYGSDAQDNLITGETLEDYSAKKYCMNQLAKTEETLTAIGLSETKQQVLRTLLVDLLNYGSEAQNYFGYKTGSLVNAELSDEQKVYASADSVIADLQNITNTKQVEITDASAEWKSDGLNLLSKTTIRLKFAYEGDISNVTMTAKVSDGEEIVVRDFESAGENLYYVYFDEFSAYQYSEPIDFTLKADGTAISNTLRYSVESYVSKTKDDAAVGSVMSAMMKYGKAAASYKNAEN